MNKTDAKKIAETVTNEQLSRMLSLARVGITKWDAISNVNKGMTKGAVWNILSDSFDPKGCYSYIAKVNMVREFGEFIVVEFMLPEKVAKKFVKPFHQEPRELIIDGVK